jgi:hypothetical protein
VRKDPDPTCDAQKQDSQVDRVEPHFDNLFHGHISFRISIFNMVSAARMICAHPERVIGRVIKRKTPAEAGR